MEIIPIFINNKDFNIRKRKGLCEYQKGRKCHFGSKRP